MPYSSNADLPEAVRSRYSSHCQDVWRNVWNSVHDKTGDESRAFASANSQANKCEGKKAMSGMKTLTVEPKFKIFAPMLKASLDADGKRRLHGIASSTIRDRHGDTMSLSALADMERSASNNLTIFLNHEYKVPEDVAGYVERAMIRQHPQDGEVHDLVLDIVVNESNPRAINAWEAIQNGTQLGLSIGAMIPDGGSTRDRKTGSFQIDHVELLETSLVGVPANPRSWVEYAVKSLNGIVERSDGEVGVLVEDDETPDPLNTFTKIPEEVLEGAGVKELDDKDFEHTDDPPELGEEPEPEPEPVETTEPTITTSSGAAATFTADPPVTDATVHIEMPGGGKVHIDTGNRGTKPAPAGEASQEALLSAPETEDQDETEDLGPWGGILPVKSSLIDADVKTALEMLEPSVVASLRNSTELLKAITRELIETKAALAERNDEYAALEAATKEVVTKTGQILDKLSNTPVGRRAVVREVSDQFAGLAGVFSEEFLDILKKG